MLENIIIKNYNKFNYIIYNYYTMIGSIDGDWGSFIFPLFLIICCAICICASSGSLNNTFLNPDTSSGGIFKFIKIENSSGGMFKNIFNSGDSSGSIFNSGNSSGSIFGNIGK
jgi:hypothetical protein